jgi:hypothetical protein
MPSLASESVPTGISRAAISGLPLLKLQATGFGITGGSLLGGTVVDVSLSHCTNKTNSVRKVSVRFIATSVISIVVVFYFAMENNLIISSIYLNWLVGFSVEIPILVNEFVKVKIIKGYKDIDKH